MPSYGFPAGFQRMSSSFFFLFFFIESQNLNIPASPIGHCTGLVLQFRDSSHLGFVIAFFQNSCVAAITDQEGGIKIT